MELYGVVLKFGGLPDVGQREIGKLLDSLRRYTFVDKVLKNTYEAG